MRSLLSVAALIERLATESHSWGTSESKASYSSSATALDAQPQNTASTGADRQPSFLQADLLAAAQEHTIVYPRPTGLGQRLLLDVCPSIYIDHCSGSETCLSRGQHLYYMRHILHLAYAANCIVEITTMTLRRNSFDHGSINNPWRNDVHRHAVRPEFLRQGFPEAYDPRLRGSIVHMSCAAAQPCHRGDEYHTPVLLSPHVGRECLRAQERPCEMYVKHLMPNMRLYLFEGLGITDTSTSY